MICPYCGDNIPEGEGYCPSCGMSVQYEYDEYGDTPPPPPEDNFYEHNSNKTAIVALDPEFNKKTRIVSNPLLEDASFKKSKRRKYQEEKSQETEDDISYLISLFKYIYVRLNFFEKFSFWSLVVAAFFSFAPWVQTVKYGTLVSGYELEGFYVALLTAGAAFLLLFKIGMRLGFWMSLIYLGLSFGGTAITVYLTQRGPLPNQHYLFSFYITVLASVLGFIALFIGSMRRFLQ